MYLETITINQYKNIEMAELSFSPSLNCFVGNNGSGKTNVLDAIHYLSLTKSATAIADKLCVKYDTDFFILKGRYESFGEDKPQTITATYKSGKRKKIMFSNKEYEKLSDHIGRFPLVMISPSDVALISDTPSIRRQFINTFFSQIDPEYLSLMIRYNGILAQRNSYLRDYSGDSMLLDIVSEQLAEVGQRIYNLRQVHTSHLSPIVSEFYSRISGGSEVIEVEYISKLSEGSMIDLLRASLQRDIALGHTSCGIHRDDLSLNMNGYPIRGVGSQGQQKSLLLALKLSEARVIAERCGRKAILLLDDVFDKLDMSRVEHLVELVSGEDFGQIFISDANKVRLEGIVEKFDTNFKMFEMSGGIAELI